MNIHSRLLFTSQILMESQAKLNLGLYQDKLSLMDMANSYILKIELMGTVTISELLMTQHKALQFFLKLNQQLFLLLKEVMELQLLMLT